MFFLLEKAYFIANMHVWSDHGLAGQFWLWKALLVWILCRVRRCFKSCQSKHESFKETGEKGEKKKKHTHLHFLLFIFSTTFLITYSKRKRKERQEGKGEDRKTKGNVKTAVTLFNPKFCFLCICIWNGRLQSAWPLNSVLGNFGL